MKEFLIGAAAIVVAGAAFAQAQPAPTPQPVTQAPVPHAAPPLTERIDTRDEMVAKVREHFAQLDVNKDGFLTKEEANAGRKLFRERIRERLGDRRDPGQAFDRLDSNKDGSISRDEFTKHREERIERRVERREKAQDGSPKDGKEVRKFVMRRHGGGFGGRMIVMADSNSDGQITMAEAETMALQHFDQMDSNKDGQVTPEERRANRNILIKRFQEEKKSGS